MSRSDRIDSWLPGFRLLFLSGRSRSSAFRCAEHELVSLAVAKLGVGSPRLLFRWALEGDAALAQLCVAAFDIVAGKRNPAERPNPVGVRLGREEHHARL